MTALENLTKSGICTNLSSENEDPQSCQMNERITEDLVRDILKENKERYPKVTIEEQKSTNPRIAKALRHASKSGSGRGSPEFIITFKEVPDLLIAVECKAITSNHESRNRDNPKDFAVDGALLYSEYLSKEFNVIAIAVSGQTVSEVKISHFLQMQGDHNVEKFVGDKILPFEDYLTEYTKNDLKLHHDFDNLMMYSKELNLKLHQLKIKESLRSLLISGILLSLQNGVFRVSYEKQERPRILNEHLVTTIRNELKESHIQEQKIQGLEREYSFIKEHEAFAYDVNTLKDIIREIDQNLNQFIKTHRSVDILGQFYIEFLRYANADTGLGIVLTPPHITELFSDIAEVNKNSVIFDNCCGTGGFLISAMKKMIEEAKGDSDKENDIRRKQLVGIEFQNDIFALACSNMFIHNDGSSSVYKGDCFDAKLMSEIKKVGIKSTIGFLNPPYKTVAKADKEELEFVLNNLEMLEPNGTCVCIIPISCVTQNTKELVELRTKLLKNHTLEAVFSMPDELFFNSKKSVVTTIIVFKAHRPHPKNKETFLGFWKDDGFVKNKILGRTDHDNRWASIKNKWLSDYQNRKTTQYCLSKSLTAKDEWCVEAYMQTDYSKITNEDFIQEIKNYALFKAMNGV